MEIKGTRKRKCKSREIARKRKLQTAKFARKSRWSKNDVTVMGKYRV